MWAQEAYKLLVIRYAKTSKSATACKRNVPHSFMLRCSRLRMTRQRRIVIDILLASDDHPTAAQILNAPVR